MKNILILISLLTLVWNIAFTMDIIQINLFESNAVTVNILESHDDMTIVEILLNHYMINSVDIEDNEYFFLDLPFQGGIWF
ncbi:MAG: hypothetical protein FWG98_15335 [Candidatus Cloacimonetes bacterium]|nr:hypothetical protein [Candidatus Cloacimonadota bacterium]